MVQHRSSSSSSSNQQQQKQQKQLSSVQSSEALSHVCISPIQCMGAIAQLGFCFINKNRSKVRLHLVGLSAAVPDLPLPEILRQRRPSSVPVIRNITPDESEASALSRRAIPVSKHRRAAI